MNLNHKAFKLRQMAQSLPWPSQGFSSLLTVQVIPFQTLTEGPLWACPPQAGGTDKELAE